MKTITTRKLTVAAALLEKGCRLAMPPYEVETDHSGRAVLSFNIEGEDPAALLSAAVSGGLTVNWRNYETCRATLVDLAKKETL